MKRGITVLSIIALGAFALTRAGAQEGPDPAREIAAWLELGKTGPEHAELMKNAGTWTVESKAWLGGPEPLSSKAKAVFTPLLGGRYLRQEFEGEFMGQPFFGIGCTGFNNATRKYEDTWIDSMGTGMMQATGVETEPGKVWEFTGSCAGPDGKTVKMRSVMKKPSEGRLTFESFCDDGSGEKKCWEAVYTRSK
jgi:hypothetical protein